MNAETFRSGGHSYEITVYPAPANGKRYPVVIFFHGNWGLALPFGSQIQDFAKAVEAEGYLTAVPKFYPPVHHAFRHAGHADVDSRKHATDWLLKYMQPKGV